MWPLGPGRAPTSPLAHFALFGYSPQQFPGRGLIEALGEGLVPEPGEVVCRANFVRAEERDGTLWITERPDPRLGESVNADVSLDGEFAGVSCRFLHSGAAQGMLHLRALDNTPLSPHVTDADPLRPDTVVREVTPFAETPDPIAAERTARALNAWMLESRRRLAGCALDMAVVKWAGAAADIPTFSARTGLRGATLARGVLYAGLAAAVGLDAPGGVDGDDLAADLREDLGTALGMLADGYDFVHVHSIWPDSPGIGRCRRASARWQSCSTQRLRRTCQRFSTAVTSCASRPTIRRRHPDRSTTPAEQSPLSYSAASPAPTRSHGSANEPAKPVRSGTCAAPTSCRCCSTAPIAALSPAPSATRRQCLGTPRDEDVIALRASEG